MCQGLCRGLRSGVSGLGRGQERIQGGQAEKKKTSSVKGRVWRTPCGKPAELRLLLTHPSSLPLQEDFVYEDMDALCSALRTLATDSNKYRAKADRRRQRSTFRAVLHSVEVRVRMCVSLRSASPGTVPSPALWAPLPCRAVSVRKKQSASASRCSTWTAGLGAGSTPPSRTLWGQACTTTSRWGNQQGGATQLVCLGRA